MVMNKLWDYLELDQPIHDFDNVKQITKEDDSIIGFTGLHDIRPKVEPIELRAKQVLGENLVKRFENLEFWKQ